MPNHTGKPSWLSIDFLVSYRKDSAEDKLPDIIKGVDEVPLIKETGKHIGTIAVGVYADVNSLIEIASDNLFSRASNFNALQNAINETRDIICLCPKSLSVCYAIDESRSIDRKEFKTLREFFVNVTQEISASASDISFIIVFFNNCPHRLFTVTQNVTEAIMAIPRNEAIGRKTAFGRALKKYQNQLLDLPEPRSIIIASDGEENKGLKGLLVAREIWATSKIEFAIVALRGLHNKKPCRNLLPENYLFPR